MGYSAAAQGQWADIDISSSLSYTLSTDAAGVSGIGVGFRAPVPGGSVVDGSSTFSTGASLWVGFYDAGNSYFGQYLGSGGRAGWIMGARSAWGTGTFSQTLFSDNSGLVGEADMFISGGLVYGYCYDSLGRIYEWQYQHQPVGTWQYGFWRRTK